MSHLAVIVLVGSVLVALVGHGLPARVTGGVEAAVCEVVSLHCGPPTAGGVSMGVVDPGTSVSAPARSGPAASGADGVRGDRAVPERGDGICWDWLGWWCGGVDGIRLGSWHALTGFWAGAVSAGCLTYVCGHSNFKNSWAGVRHLVAHPIDSFKAIWHDETKSIRDDWNNGHRTRAYGRSVPAVAGVVFGGKGSGELPKLAKGGKGRKLHKASTPNEKTVDGVDSHRNTPEQMAVPLMLSGRQALEQLSRKYGDTVLYHGSPSRLNELEPRQMNWLDKDRNKYPDGDPAVCAATCYDVPIFMSLFKNRARFRYYENALGETTFMVDRATLTADLEDLEGYIYVLGKEDFERFVGAIPDGWPGPATSRAEEYRAFDKVKPMAVVKVTIKDFPAPIIFE